MADTSSYSIEEHLTYVTEDMEAHPFVCPASRCTYRFTGHVTKAYVIQIKLW